jgi:hypothetical protein
LRAVFRLFLCQIPLSPVEYRAVLDKLVTSVRRLASGKDSFHYLDNLRKTLAELAEKAKAEEAHSEVLEGEPTNAVEA